MKKLALVLSVLLLVGMAAGCGGGGKPSEANYIDVIRAARDAEQNQVFYIVADEATRAGAAVSATSAASAVQDESGELFEMPDPETMDEQHRAFVFNEATGLSPDAMEKYGISIGFSITQAYGIAIVLPKEGQEQAVTDMLNGYVLIQQKAQENYLQDQYQIAKNAVVRTVGTGEVIMVMCADSSTVAAAIEAGLKG